MERNTILIPIDFSEQSLIALKQSFNIARFSEAQLLLLHVIDQDFLHALAQLFKDQYYEDPVIDAAKSRLDELARKTEKDSGLRVNTTIRKGKIYEEIVHVANEINAKFIVMGTHGESGLKKKFMGSNAARVIKEAECPVITIKGKEHHRGCKKIVLPLDLTRETKEKVDKAIELANYFGSSIYVVSVTDTDDEFLMNKLNRQMKQVTEFISASGINVNHEMLQGSDIPTEIINYAKNIDADLIIIMTQQEIYWTEMFIGFAAQEIINNSAIPVLCIRPKLRSLTEFVTS